MTEDWERTLLVDSERIAITDGVCNKYKTTWEDMVEGKLSSRDLEQCVIDIYEAVAKAQAKATWKAREPEIVAAYQAGIQKVVEWARESCPHTITELVDGKFEDISKGECGKCWEAIKKEWVEIKKEGAGGKPAP